MLAPQDLGYRVRFISLQSLQKLAGLVWQVSSDVWLALQDSQQVLRHLSASAQSIPQQVSQRLSLMPPASKQKLMLLQTLKVTASFMA